MYKKKEKEIVRKSATSQLFKYNVCVTDTVK